MCYRGSGSWSAQVHNDPPDKVTPTSFDRFLCTNPFPPSSAPFEEGEPLPDGAVHALYRLDGVLIAFAVLDVLPDCISSVYFVWDPDYAGLGLGKLGALREIAMAKELDLKFYYMGACLSGKDVCAAEDSGCQASTSTRASRCGTKENTARASS